MGKPTQVINSSNSGKVRDDFKNIMLSFQNNKPLNNDQREFIKSLCNTSLKKFDHYDYTQIVHDNSPTCFFYANNLNISECGTYCVTVMFSSIDVIKFIKQTTTEEEITTKLVYLNFLIKIGQCYA